MNYFEAIEQAKKEKSAAENDIERICRPFNIKRRDLETEVEKATKETREKIEVLKRKIEKLYLEKEQEEINELKEKFRNEPPDESNFIKWINKIGYEIFEEKLSNFDDVTMGIGKNVVPGLIVLGARDYRKKIYVAFSGVDIVGWLVVYPSSHPGDSTSAECVIKGRKPEVLNGSWVKSPYKSFIAELKK